MRKILPSITTTPNSDWRAKIKEINKLGLKEAALFPTCLNKKERQEMYKLLENSTIKAIPLVHIRNDMPPEELDYLIKKFQVEAFNKHTHSEFPFQHRYSKHRKMIFIENVYHPFDEKELKRFGGICLDVSHLENDKLIKPEKFEHNKRAIDKYPIGCNHISCIQKTLRHDEKDELCYYSHFLRKLSQLDYLKKYPKKYFSPIVALELENTIETQLKVRDYLINKIGL
jgi:hypothetical protein